MPSGVKPRKRLPVELRMSLQSLIQQVLAALAEKASVADTLPIRRVPHIAFGEGGSRQYTYTDEPDFVELGKDLCDAEEFSQFSAYEDAINTLNAVQPPIKWSLVGTGGLELIVPQYLRGAKNLSFDSALFSQVYDSFEQFAVSPNFRLTTHAFLQGLVGDFDSIQLGEVRIRRLSNAEREKLYFRFETWFPPGISEGSLLDHAYMAEIETRHGGLLDASVGEAKVDDVVLALRLFKGGFVRRHQTYTEGKSPWDMAGTLRPAPRARLFGTGKYTILESEVGQLHDYWHAVGRILVTKPSPLDIAFKRFSDAYERREAVDKLIDLFIALEAIYLKEGDKEEITHKLSERVALFIEYPSENASQVLKRMKKAYGIRGAVVHGKKVGNISEAVPFAEECVRLTLRKLALASAAGMNPGKIPDILEQAVLSKAPFTLVELIETAHT